MFSTAWRTTLMALSREEPLPVPMVLYLVCIGGCGWYVEDVMVSVRRRRRRRRRGVLVRKVLKPTQYMYHSQDSKIPPNSAVGRLLMETVSMVPQIDSSHFDRRLTQPYRYTVLVKKGCELVAILRDYFMKTKSQTHRDCIIAKFTTVLSRSSRTV